MSTISELNAAQNSNNTISRSVTHTHQNISWRGQNVVVSPDPVSMLLDAQEEIGAMRAGDRSLESRNPKRSIKATSLGIDLAKEFIARGELLDSLDTGVIDRIEEQIKGLKQKGDSSTKTKADLNTVLDQFDKGSPHLRFALLVALKENPITNNRVLTSSILNSTIDSTYQQSGAAIRLGFNSVNSVREHADLAPPSELKTLYLDIVLKTSTLSHIYRSVIDGFGKEKFTEVIKFLISTAGYEITAIVSSTDIPALRCTVTSLKKFQIMRTIETSCYSVIPQLNEAIKPDVGGVEIFSSVLSLVEIKWPLPETVSAEVEKLAIPSPQALVWVHNSFCALIEAIPTSVFLDENKRDVLITALRDARSIAAEIEEKEEYEIGITHGELEAMKS